MRGDRNKAKDPFCCDGKFAATTERSNRK